MERRRDDELVAGYLAGDDACIAELIRRYQAPLLRMLEGITGDRGMAEDAAQETFLAAACAMEGIDRPERFRSWLFSIAHRKGTRMVKRESSRIAPVSIGDRLEPVAPGSAGRDDEPWIRERFRRILRNLPGRDRTLLDLRFLEEFSHGDIARITGSSAVAVRMRIWRLKQRLLERLEAPGESPA